MPGPSPGTDGRAARGPNEETSYSNLKHTSNNMLSAEKFKNKTSLADSRGLSRRALQAPAAAKRHREMKQFLTLQMNQRTLENQDPQRRVQRLVREGHNLKGLFDTIYRNRSNTSRLKKDILRLIQFETRAKGSETRASKTAPRRRSGLSRGVRGACQRKGSQRAKPKAKLKQTRRFSKKMKINIKKSAQTLTSTTSIERLYTTKQLVFPPDPTKLQPKRRAPAARDPSENKQFALRLVKQSFMQINKELLNARAKANLRALGRLPSSNNVLLKEILRCKELPSYFETMSNSEDKLEVFASFLDKLRDMFCKKGFGTEAAPAAPKRHLKTIIRKNMRLFTESGFTRQPQRHV